MCEDDHQNPDEFFVVGVRFVLRAIDQHPDPENCPEDSHREESPLRKAADAIILDNSTMDFDEQVDFVLVELKKLIKESNVDISWSSIKIESNYWR